MWCKHLNTRRNLPPPKLERERKIKMKRVRQKIEKQHLTWFGDVNSSSANFVSFKTATVSFIMLAVVTASCVFTLNSSVCLDWYDFRRQNCYTFITSSLFLLFLSVLILLLLFYSLRNFQSHCNRWFITEVRMSRSQQCFCLEVDLSSVSVRAVSILLFQIYRSHCLFSSLLWIILLASYMIVITVIFLFSYFFTSQARSRYFSSLSLSFILILL